MGFEWSFEQLGGERRKLTLAGRAAPHGRPRQGPVVSDGIKLRRQRVHYPDGSQAPPTTHIFGVQWSDWELKGRFEDSFLGKGQTLLTIRAWQAFVADGQPVLISWGDVITAEGIVDEFEPGRESPYESTYRIVLLIDQRWIGAPVLATLAPPAPTAICEGVQASAAIVDKELEQGIYSPSFLETLEDARGTLGTVSSTLTTLAGQIDYLTESPLDQLEQLRAGANQIRVAALRLREAIFASNTNDSLLSRDADSDIRWFASRSNIDVATVELLALLTELDREVELARRGRTLAVYVARQGDSWESISTQFFGGPENAGLIRDANGVLYGAIPFPGRSYQIPVAA